MVAPIIGLIIWHLWCPTIMVQATISTIATFNIQNLGPSKVSNPEVLSKLTQILTRYDIILIQEVQDKTGKAIPLLKQLLNTGKSKDKQHDYILSNRVGYTSGQEEQYAIFYRPRVVKVVKYEHYADPRDEFSRDPFLTEIQYRAGGLPNFVLVNLHARPDSSTSKATVQEIDGLTDVYSFIQNKFKTTNVIFMGDLNADGRYVTKRDWNNIRLRTDDRFQWLISDDEDTTVGNSNNAYDRIIVAGPEIQSAIVPGSALVFHFDEDMNTAEALKISDHYPVEVKLQTSA